MEGVTDRQALFRYERARLFGIAYRMLGSKTDAEDMVQETYLRWHQANLEEVRSPKAWLSTVLIRSGVLIVFRVVRGQAASLSSPWLPEPLVGNFFSAPEEQAELVSRSFHGLFVLLERLTPEERAAFFL